MNIPDGSIIGVSGASGIGKSTLAKILCGVTAPDAGEVFLDGQLLVSPKSNYDRRRGLSIQMVYQQPYATLDPSQKIGVGLRELISYHRLTKKGAGDEDTDCRYSGADAAAREKFSPICRGRSPAAKRSVWRWRVAYFYVRSF